jgi:hypothetical protein
MRNIQRMSKTHIRIMPIVVGAAGQDNGTGQGNAEIAGMVTNSWRPSQWWPLLSGGCGSDRERTAFFFLLTKG